LQKLFMVSITRLSSPKDTAATLTLHHSPRPTSKCPTRCAIYSQTLLNLGQSREYFVYNNSILLSNPTPTPVNGFTWPPYRLDDGRAYVELNAPEVRIVNNSDIMYPTARFWNDYVTRLATYISTAEARRTLTGDSGDQLTSQERTKLEAYERAWLALWVSRGEGTGWDQASSNSVQPHKS
jgi:hypothetical protein